MGPCVRIGSREESGWCQVGIIRGNVQPSLEARKGRCRRTGFPAASTFRPVISPGVIGPHLCQVLSLSLIRETHGKPNSSTWTHPPGRPRKNPSHGQAHSRSGSHGVSPHQRRPLPERVLLQFTPRLIPRGLCGGASSAPRGLGRNASALKLRSFWQRRCAEKTPGYAAGKRPFSPLTAGLHFSL